MFQFGTKIKKATHSFLCPSLSCTVLEISPGNMAEGRYKNSSLVMSRAVKLTDSTLKGKGEHYFMEHVTSLLEFSAFSYCGSHHHSLKKRFGYINGEWLCYSVYFWCSEMGANSHTVKPSESMRSRKVSIGSRKPQELPEVHPHPPPPQIAYKDSACCASDRGLAGCPWALETERKGMQQRKWHDWLVGWHAGWLPD